VEQLSCQHVGFRYIIYSFDSIDNDEEEEEEEEENDDSA